MNRLTKRFFEAPMGVFTLADSTVAVAGSNEGRYGLIKRAIAGEEILNIRRGLYCLAPEYQKKPVCTYSLAQRIYGPSYISMETALSYHGWIPEEVYTYTCVSYRSAKEFNTPIGLFSYKPVPQRTFYFGVERCEDENGNIFFMASPAKSLADYLYIHHLSWTDIHEAAESMRIDTQDLISVKVRELSGLIKNYKNSRVKRFLTNWRENLIK